MPESNGKSNFTAVLMRKGADLFDGIAGGMTIARSEYPDRVRYEADCVRWLIGELDERPCIIDYDADKHSGYVAQHSAPERVSVPDTARLDFMLQERRKVVVERLPHDNFEVYVEEGLMGDKRYPGVRYSGEWEQGEPEALEIQREAIDAALLSRNGNGGVV